MKASKSRNPSRAVRSHAGLGELEVALTHAQSERGWADFYDFDDDLKRWDAAIARRIDEQHAANDGREHAGRNRRVCSIALFRVISWRVHHQFRLHGRDVQARRQRL